MVSGQKNPHSKTLTHTQQINNLSGFYNLSILHSQHLMRQKLKELLYLNYIEGGLENGHHIYMCLKHQQ